MNLMIVDDESYVREGIERILSTCNLPDLSILKAANGHDALRMAVEHRVDIVISDVRMPQMNGLDMAKALLQELPRIKLIFISAYSELEYYRAAMKLRAVSFVEKPIVPEDLVAEVRRAHEMVQMENQRTQPALSRRDREQLMLLDLLHQNSVHIPSDASLVLHPERPLALYVIGRLGAAPGARLLDDMEEAVHQLVAPAEHAVLCGMDGTYCILLVSVAMLSRRMVCQIAERVQAKLHASPVFVTCAMAANPDELQLALESARSDQRYSFFYPQAYFYHHLHTNIIQSPVEICSSGVLSRLSGCVEESDAEGALQLVRQTLRQLLPPALCDPEHVRLSALQLINALEDSLRKSGAEDIARSGWQDFSALSSYDEVEHVLLARVASCFDLQKERTQDRRCIYLIKREIETRYADPELSVSSLAEKFRMSESYIGNYFKRHTGMTISGYLNTVRMEQAKRLLSDPTNRVSEVGQLIGIENTDYFTRRFKQYTGKTPSEYRR